jgi:hypothetical protein
LAGKILKELSGLPDVLEKPVLRQRCYPHMIPTMACDLMTFRGDRLDHAGLSFRQPPENEKGAPNLPFRTMIQESPHESRRTPRKGVPLFPRDQALQCRSLEILLDIDGKVVSDHQ